MQFHPEVTHTRQGARILRRFVHDICGCAPGWTPAAIIEDGIERVRREVGGGHVLLALSGGVDSSVVAALLHRAIGDRLKCIFVDNACSGSARAIRSWRRSPDISGSTWSGSMPGAASSPRWKAPPIRKKSAGASGRLFIEIFEEEAARLDGIRWLAQGTIYPDVIESAAAATGKAHVIKSHHNVGGLPSG